LAGQGGLVAIPRPPFKRIIVGGKIGHVAARCVIIAQGEEDPSVFLSLCGNLSRM